MEGEECCAAEENDDNMDSFVDIMNISMKELSIDERDDESDIDELQQDQFMRSSTPRGKSKGEKHDLTPSKKLVEPSAKRRNIAPPSLSIRIDKQNEQKTMSSAKVVNPSGAVVKRRRSLLVNLLKETYEKCPGSTVTQDSAIDKMGLKSADCIKLTNAMKVAFPDTMNKRVQDKEGKWSIVYTNLRLRKKFIMSEDGGKKQVLFPESSEINNVKLKLGMLHSDLSNVVKEIETALTLEVINRPFIRVCIEKQRKLQEDIKTFTETLERLYEKEMSNLAKSKDPEHLCSEEIFELQKEMNIFIDMLNLGLKESLDLNLDNIFNTLTSNVEEKCPLVYQIVEQLFLVKPSTLEIQKGRVKSAVHSLAILVSLKSQMIKNDFKLLFSILCVSYGAGMRFINMLNHAGLSVSWDTLMNFFDSRMTKFEEYLESVAPENVPIVLLLDNINLYKGKRRHLRLFKYIAPTVWNFTGQALIIPNIDGIQHLFREKKTALESQQDPLSLEPEEVLYTSYKDKVELWEKYRDMYLLSIMDAAYNKVPKLGKDRMKDMSETDFDTWLKNANFSTVKAQFEIDVPNVKSIIKSTHLKTNVSILPLSLEDNSIIAGTATILDDWANIFSLPFSSDKTTFIPFDVVRGNFDIQLARSRVEYLNSKFRHQNYMADHEAQLRSKEKTLYGQTLNELQLDENDDSEKEDTDVEDACVEKDNATTLDNEKRRFRREDEKFWSLYNELASHLRKSLQSDRDEEYNLFIQASSQKNVTITDHLGRSLLHIAAEKSNNVLAKSLVFTGCNVNAKEHCGLTPLHLAVLSSNVNLCTFLVEANAAYTGPMFSGIPSPKQMAEKLHLEQINALFVKDLTVATKEDDLIKLLDSVSVGESDDAMEQEEHAKHIEAVCATGYKRSTNGFITPVVGDVGTCKTNNAVMSRSNSYSWVGICLGDLHNKGYHCEAVFKEHGQTGLHYVVAEVMKRKQLTKEAFKTKKFQENYLSQIREAVRDTSKAYGIAACFDFKESTDFPTKRQLMKCKMESGSHNRILLEQFKSWAQKSKKSDKVFEHNLSLLMYHGPLLQLYDHATAYGDGNARELVYQLQIPIYAQLGFRNYYQETFRAVVNLLAKWPKATRELVKQNCCVNLSGQEGHGIELDAFVESEVVRPLKVYSSGHTTVKMSERIMGNINLFKLVRTKYKSKEGFNVYHTSRHSEQSPFPDQLKGAWFCSRNNFFSDKSRAEIPCIPLDKKGQSEGKLSSKFISVLDKGIKKFQDDFKAKLFACFPDLRYKMLAM